MNLYLLINQTDGISPTPGQSETHYSGFSDNMIEVKRTHEATDNRYNDIIPTQVIDIYLKSVRYNGRDHCWLQRH